MTSDSKKRTTDEDSKGNKKTKVNVDFESAFAEGLFAKSEDLRQQIMASGPYKHGVIQPLFDDELLKTVRKEIESELHFTQKETDIYKVFQTGDLANISALESDDLVRVSSLAKLRDALYSQEFRDYLSKVTGSGPLSGSKKDLSINVYQKGCHLLNHDDVIGTRRISYILYLVDTPWLPKWGGALRLFPTLKPNIPATDWTKSIPPVWNQLAFFTVQPGLSFHDVEEVFVDKPRLSISGWFHIPQEGEKGYVEGQKEDGLSSLKQLEVLDPDFDFPKRTFVDTEIAADAELSKDDKAVLSKYLAPELLEVSYLETLSEDFCENSSLNIKPFLNDDYASALKMVIDEDDLATLPTTSHTVSRPWDIARPPHKARYLYLTPEDDKDAKGSSAKLKELSRVFQSEPYLRWLKLLSNMIPKSSYILARRFRPGFDFTLATTNEDENAYLEGVLNLTPSKGWKDGELGGYDLAMNGDEDAELDPAVYRGANNEEDDDGVIFNNQLEWNSFSLIVRDNGILRFIKYVSKNAPGSRWDIACEWRVDDDADDDDDDDDENKDQQ